MDVARTVFVVMYISEALYAVEPTAEVHRFENTSVQLNCPHRATSSNVLAWEYSPVYPTSAWTIYTLNRDLNTKLPSYPRFNVTGDFSNGEYNFVINILKKEDEGYYKCNLRSTSIESVQKLVILDVIEPVTQVYKMNRSSVQLNCSHRATSSKALNWNYSPVYPFTTITPYTINEELNTDVPAYPRFHVTGDFSSGEYNLVINNLKEEDEGYYICNLESTSKETVQELVIVEGPTSVTISNKLGNTFPGTEDHDLTIRCTANGGDPAPNMKLMIGNESYTVTNKHAIERTISKVSRSYDSVTVTCQSAYDGVTYTPQTDTAVLRLSLKPFLPVFSINPVVTESTKYLVLTCTSTGSRPAPTDRIWLIGDSNVDITSSSTSVSSSQQSDGTYVATSTLTYKVNKGYNQKLIKCGFKNTASGNNYVQGSTTVNVMYAPDVSVRNKTFTLIQSSREIQCVVNGNPASSFFKWQHKSNYGELVREFDGSSTLVLPIQSEEDRYQDTGEYVCTASNGIRDEEGNLDQRGSGYVISQAPTRFLYGSSQIKLGQYGKDVDIDISVYSVPKHQTPTWLRRDISLSQSKKYTMSEETQIITYTFYGNLIRADGFTLTLTIRNLSHQDFDNYTLKLSNGVGETVEYLVILKALGPPDEPYNFTYIDVTESAVTLQWLPGYDGGHEQTFVIQYRIKDLKVWNEKQVSKYDLFSSVGSNIFTLTGLDAGKLYEIRMYSRNKIGRSLSSDIQKVSTTCSVCDVERNSVTGVAVGLSIVTVISLISNGILAYKLLHAKKMLSGNSSKNRSVDRKSYPEVYYNITDDKEDTDQRSELEVRQYETMGTKDKPNVYEGLDHEIRTDKEHFGKGEDYETLGTKEKSNVYEELDQKPNDSTSKIYSNTLI